jgi:hypothetical protein
MQKNKLLGFVFGLILLSSCYTKKQAIDKFCHQDTAVVMVEVHDTTIVERIVADTVFSASIDSFVITKDKLVIKYLKIRDSIYLSGEYKGDTIYKIREITVKTPCNCPPEYVPGFWDKVKSWLAVFGIISFLIFAFVLSPWAK